MEENYEVNAETLRSDLEEVLSWLKGEIMSAPKSVPVTEQGKKAGNSEFSQDVDAYVKIWGVYQNELSRDIEYENQLAERERKNLEYLDNAEKNTRDFNIRTRDLDLKEQIFRDESRDRTRDLDIKERDIDIREMGARENGKWWNKPIVATAATCLTALTINGIAIYMNGSEAPLKSIYEKWMIRVNPK